jgi:hypothetical protein
MWRMRGRPNWRPFHFNAHLNSISALGVAERVWTVADLLDAVLATQPIHSLRLRRIGGSGGGSLKEARNKLWTAIASYNTRGRIN